MRDYIHVMDVVEGHVRSRDVIEATGQVHTVNIGTGQGYPSLRLSVPMKRFPASRYRTALRRAVQEMLLFICPMQLWPVRCWASRPNAICLICAGQTGLGYRKTRDGVKMQRQA